MTKLTVLHILQHVPFEGPGFLRHWAERRGMEVRFWHLYSGERTPQPGAGEALCIMGGPMNIYEDDAFPWLRWERDFLTEQARRSTPMLGVCLGAQLLAHAHGARVFKNEVKEIGWMPLQFSDADFRNETGLPITLPVLHWHGDTFDLPPAARRLAKTEFCLNQAFVCGRSLGLQFHLEAGTGECERMIANCGSELVSGSPTIHAAADILEGARKHASETEAVLEKILAWHFPETSERLG